MTSELAQWPLFVALLTAVFLLFAVTWFAWGRVANKREAERRIAAARIRSGHVPLEIPTVRSRLTPVSDDSEPDTLPEWFIQGKGEYAVVDQHPRIRVRFLDPAGKKAELTMQVDHLDLQRKTLIGHSEIPGDIHLPLHRITAARIAESGQRFNVDTWVEAVRVARRRSGMA